jgi:general secretion pathway protein G
MNMRRFGFHRGFTLIELVISVAIIGLLASVALPMAELTVQRNKEHDLRVALRDIRTALDSYRQAVSEGRVARLLGSSGYPPSLGMLVEGVPDAASPDKTKMIYFLRRIPRDPMSEDSNKTDEESWGKRSYSSSADAPEEGDDVFDVYSRSTNVGLNGIPYRNW